MKKLSYSLGFTLIELLVVIAILGVLAGGVLIAIDPLEQLARGRDAGRKTTVDQLGKAVQAYYTSQSAVYPTQDPAWMVAIQTSGELKTLPTNPSGGGTYDIGCNTATALAASNKGYCYQTDDVDAVIYARAESKSSLTGAGCAAGEMAWIVWSSEQGKTGLTCTDGSDPSITGLILK